MNGASLLEFKLDQRRALVTGSASGIGLATAERLACSGARVAMNDLPTEVLTRAVDGLKLTDDFWDRILRVNLMSAFWMTQSVAAALTDARGAVVNTVGLTRELARGLAPAVRVNGIAPGYVNSNWECSFGDMDAAARKTVPLARVGEPGDYAEVIVYLCAGAAYITGEVIPVTGGSRI